MSKKYTYMLAAYCCALFFPIMAAAENELEAVTVGGLGGNPNGKIIYNDFYYPTLQMMRDKKGTCYFRNQYVQLTKYGDIINFPCKEPHPVQHLYWSGDFDSENGGDSLANDTLYAATIVSKMYESWYQMPLLLNGHQRQGVISITLTSYYSYNDVLLRKSHISPGHGSINYYPFTSLSVMAFQLGDLFTQQHACFYSSGNEGAAIGYAFAEMTAVAASYYAYGIANWQVGAEVRKDNKAFYYVDQPTKNCGTKKPGDNCSIDSVEQYNKNLSSVYASGIYARAFYLIATSPGWNIQKAYGIMIRANKLYWSENTTFLTGARDVVKATKEMGYDTDAVVKGFKAVGIDVLG